MMYRTFRRIYRTFDRVIVGNLPLRSEWWLSGLMFRLARSVTGPRLKARTVGEFVAGAHTARLRGHLPSWVRPELFELAVFEKELRPLAGGTMEIGEYVIPWDATLAGDVYFQLRRAARGKYDVVVLAAAPLTKVGVDRILTACQGRVLVLELDGGASGKLTYESVGPVQRVVLPRLNLGDDERAAIVARLLLQTQPIEILTNGGSLADACIGRHSKALRQVSTLVTLSADGLQRLQVDERLGSGRP